MVVGLFSDEGDVDKVSIDGETDYSSNEYFKKDVKVVIRYHSYPEEEKASKKDDTSDSKNNDVDEKKENTDEKTVDEKFDAMENKEVITVANNELFKKIVNAKDRDIKDLKEFAKKYELRTIEFKGNVRAFAYVNDKQSRFDMLFNTLDYEEDTCTGPNFKFDYASANEIGLEYGEEVPYKVGDNVTVKAQVDEYDEEHGVFKLYPLKLTKRK